MDRFNYFNPVRLVFGEGRAAELGQWAALHGKKALLVTERWDADVRGPLYKRCAKSLEKAGLKVTCFDEVIPNPTTDEVAGATKLGKEAGCDLVVGVGGGSAMDVAKAAAVTLRHPGGIWKYVFSSKTQPSAKTLPIVLLTTTSGTGSHMSKCSVVTNPKTHEKFGVVSDHIFAKVAIVDPALMVSLPPRVTASTGFDVFTHAFESYINVNANSMIDAMTLESIDLLAQYLPKAVRKGEDLEARTMMALADTFAGMSIANVGTTLPHSMAQAISGHFPHVPHGTALAAVYPPIFEWSWNSDPEAFAAVARLLDPALAKTSERNAAKASGKALVKFLKKIGLYVDFADIGVDPNAIPALTRDALAFPDTNVHPRVADGRDIEKMLRTLAR